MFPYLTTPRTHLHREPHAALPVFLSRVSGSKDGFFKYGSTKAKVASGNWLSSNDINSSINLSMLAICLLAPFCQVKSADGDFTEKNRTNV